MMQQKTLKLLFLWIKLKLEMLVRGYSAELSFSVTLHPPRLFKTLLKATIHGQNPQCVNAIARDLCSSWTCVPKMHNLSCYQ